MIPYLFLDIISLNRLTKYTLTVTVKRYVSCKLPLRKLTMVLL